MRAPFNAENKSGFPGYFGTWGWVNGCYRAHFPESTNGGGNMDVSKIDAMLAQLQTGAARAAGKMAPISTASNAAAGGGVDFTSVLKKSLDHVNNVQQHATKLGRDFELGAPEANLTEAMISMQKASISFQYTLQVRNKLVSAYQDIMNMPV
ncbi:flagellar hook-basal body complex protein FliE [Nitrosovibrio sp. Nv4]|uniref:flagellar hook-basal body complex protein FliE n=1 Tax=Nitrosovibrio sp. Nv4 TaxID=1945880 RepID=UPI0030DC09AA